MKNANLKSEDEMFDMLLSGVHLFDAEGAELYFNKKFVFDGWSGFRRKNAGGIIDPISGSWKNFAQMQIKPKWQDSSSEETPKLCHVWNPEESKARNFYTHVYKYVMHEEYSYKVIKHVNCYRYAEPVTPDSEFLYRDDD